MPCSLIHEHRLSALGFEPIAGIDEAGRGPLAGPVVVGAVILPPNFVLSGLNDSKKLTSNARERLYAEITSNPAIRWTSISISPQEIDRLNILGATDVITFPYGEILVCAPVATARAREFGNTPTIELALYIIHGLLHLSGHDDIEPAQAKAMAAMQQKILDAALARVTGK
jgi:rRNA maturation RNase YbeY